MPRKAKVEDWYDVYWYYFNCTNLDKTITLEKFGLYKGTKKEGNPSKIWSQNLYNHKEEYLLAKKDFYGDMGCSEPNLITRMNDLSDHARSEQVRYQATQYLLEWLEKTSDDSFVSKANKLVVEVVTPEHED